MMSAERPEGPEAGDEENIRLQTHCPIMNLPIDRALYHDHEGQRIYVCCPGCLDEVRERAAEIISEHAARGIVLRGWGKSREDNIQYSIFNIQSSRSAL
jgi:hypothetical protein